MRRIIGIGGGIGSGKSVVSRICRLRGYDVYDCDSCAKQIMDNSPEVKSLIRSLCGDDVFMPDGSLDRKAFSSHFFSRQEVSCKINRLVHSLVRDDISAEAAHGGGLLFVESAILISSGIADMSHAVWLVTAPEDVRVGRVKRRSGLSEAEIKARIDVQKGELDFTGKNVPVEIIDNSGKYSLVLRTSDLIEKISRN